VRSSWLTTAAALVAAAGFSALVQGPLWKQDAALAAVNLAVTLVFVFTGLMLRKEPGQLGVAWALMLTGLFRSADFIDGWNGPWPFYGLVFGAVDRLFGAYALLRYPNSSLLRYQRVYLIVLTVWMLVGRTLIAITSTAQWNGSSTWWWPALIPDQRLTDVLNYVVNAGEGLLGATMLVLLAMRLVKTTGLDRIVIAPFIVAGIAAVIAAIASAVSQMLVSLDSTPNGAYLLESAVDLSVPLAFLVAVIQRALLLRNIPALTSRISEGADVSAVRYALRSTLHDPTLDVVDLSAAAPGPELDNQQHDRLVEFIRTEAGTPIAVVIADPALARYRGLFDAAVQTSGLALKHAQLQAQAAREKLEQVRASRARIIEAGLAERRRIERDLHDGVQQHLLGLAARLTAATTRTTDPEATAAFRQARDELKEALAELRDLAHGIHPAVLSQAGLAAALEEVVERLPLPVRVIAPASRASAAAEATAYFVTCEALTNVVKHAKADSATVTIRIDESHLDVEIADNGIGGVRSGGHGMTSILDRVSALDGAVTIDSPSGKGTRITVRIPCC
jgi:signal transduction histidine kinase